jgi:hypothetical protein
VVSTPRRNSRPPRLQGLKGHPPADQPIQSDTGSLDPKYSKTSQFSVIRRFIGIESHASESYYLSCTVATSGVNRRACQICHNRLFRKKLPQNILPMISTEVSSLTAHNTRRRLRAVFEMVHNVLSCVRRNMFRFDFGITTDQLRCTSLTSPLLRMKLDSWRGNAKWLLCSRTFRCRRP